MIVPIAPPFFSLASYVPASCQASLTMMGAQGFSWTSVVQSSQARRRFATRASPESTGETTGEATVKLAPSTRKMDHVHHARTLYLAALIMVLVVIVGLSSSSFTFSSAQWRVPPPREQSVHLVIGPTVESVTFLENRDWGTDSNPRSPHNQKCTRGDEMLNARDLREMLIFCLLGGGGCRMERENRIRSASKVIIAVAVAEAVAEAYIAELSILLVVALTPSLVDPIDDVLMAIQ